jgi:hypothetical protein
VNRPQVANKAATAAMTFVIGVVALIAFAEIEGAISMPGWLYATIGIVAVVLAGLVMAIHSTLKRWALTFLLLSLLGVSLRTLYAIDWSTRKPFQRDLNQIQPGMSKAEVEQIMRGYIHGWDPSRGMLWFRHSEEAAFNADAGIVTLQNGRVVSVEFSPD